MRENWCAVATTCCALVCPAAAKATWPPPSVANGSSYTNSRCCLSRPSNWSGSSCLQSGITTKVSNHDHSGRQNSSICRWVKQRKKSRTVSSPGNQPMPSSACKARAPRSQSTCAKRLAPVTTAKKNAEKVCANGMALSEVGTGNGMACATRTPKPIC